MYNHKRIVELTVKELELDIEEQEASVTDANCRVCVKHGLIKTLILAYKELYNNPLQAIIVKKQQKDKETTVIKEDDGKEHFKFQGEEHEESDG